MVYGASNPMDKGLSRLQYLLQKTIHYVYTYLLYKVIF